MNKRELTRKFHGLLQALFEELDQEAIHADVDAMRVKEPDLPREQLAAAFIRKAARQSAAVGAAAGSAPGPAGLMAMGPDLFNLVRQQSRLVLAIAFVYEQEPRLPDRFREVLATLAVAAGASVGRQGVRKLVATGVQHEFAERLARKIAGRYLARHLPAIAPIIGSVLGGTLNYLAVRAVGRAAVDFYSRLFEEQRSGAAPPAERRSAPRRKKSTTGNR